ncbi:aldehyde dehydrogenase family protein [Flaviramulus sp. BrNp1-15]|uniref:aldehyde dehydrogenase family protein n=1 Tax=Flaviramulus sp. BrNp1-15 TaxID=2916754 RepID=UPI001EE8E353|nr:aldehyde dehydrogenase family protein [Flaviramulus sp. BrNp1-15]ULC58740.1 aldehyde dehydrogenase family protein [Flaviramulus sp. BrNp1-15]
MKFYKNLNKQFINGEWINGQGEDLIDVNPYNDEEITIFKSATKKDVDNAHKAAKKAFKSWSKTLPQERRGIILNAINIIDKRKDEIADWIVKESGSARVKAETEIMAATLMMHEAASMPNRMEGRIYPSPIPGKESRAYRKSLGVLGIITPWNFPFHLSMRSIAPALALGNTIVVKPASSTPVSGATLIAKIFEEAGIPKGVFNVTAGKGSDIGDYFVKHPISKLISFTGSTPVGKNIGKIAGEALKKVSLELGGNNVFIVREDANIEKAAEAAVFGKFYHQGQICMAINRILVHEKIFEEFKNTFIKKVKALKVGNPTTDEKVIIGPIIDNKEIDRIMENLQKSLANGAKLELGGKQDNNIIEPTVLTNVTNDMVIANEETFGPIAPLIKFKNDEEAIEIANSLEFGLSGAIFSKNTEEALAMAHNIETGMVHINDQTVNDDANAPFGGEKGSGMGRFNGEFVLEEFTTVQWITIQHEARDYAPLA